MQDNNFGDIYSLAFSHDSLSILTANFDFSIKIWDVSNYKEILKIYGQGAWINSVKFDPLNSIIIAGCADSTIQVWNTLTYQ